MRRCLLSTVLVGIFCGSVAMAADPPKFRGYADLEGVPQHVSSFSPDNHAATVLFRNLDTGVSGKNGSLTGSRTLSFVVPLVSPGETPVTVAMDIRGFVSTTGASRALLVTQAGGKTTVIDPTQAAAPPVGPARAGAGRQRNTGQSRGAGQIAR